MTPDGWERSRQAARTFLDRAHRQALRSGRVEDADAIRAEAYAGDEANDLTTDEDMEDSDA